MTPSEAKAILQASHAPMAGEDDPRLQEAFSLLQEDDQLAAWFANENAFDDAFREKLASITPPPGLRERILAAHEEASPQQEPIPFSTRQPARPWWQNPKRISIAASIIFLATFGTLLIDPSSLMADPDIPDFYDHVSSQAHTLPQPHKLSSDLQLLRQFLDQQDYPVPGEMLAGVDPLVEVGAYKHTWQDCPVSVIIKKGDRPYMLYVMELVDFGDDDTPPAYPEVRQHGPAALLIWADSEHLYVLSSTGSPQQLAAML